MLTTKNRDLLSRCNAVHRARTQHSVNDVDVGSQQLDESLTRIDRCRQPLVEQKATRKLPVLWECFF